MPKYEAAQLIKSGDYLLQTGNHSAARRAYLKAQESDPNYTDFIEERLTLARDAESGVVDPMQKLNNSGVDLVDFEVYHRQPDEEI